MRIRSLVGLVPLFACDTIEQREIDKLSPVFGSEWNGSSNTGRTYGPCSLYDGAWREETDGLLSLVNAEQSAAHSRAHVR